jgi:isopenicillin-N epimerase
VTPRTRLALLDHVTSHTALVLPVARLVAELAARGVDTLIDAAHAPGMVPMHLDEVGAAYTSGNFHKWVCAPRGAAFLHVRRDRQERIRPLVISHGANSPRRDRSRFRLESDWTGSFDPTPLLCVPEALRFFDGLLPGHDGGRPPKPPGPAGGVSAWMEHNHAAALAARRTLCAALHLEPPCPDEMIGAMASLVLPVRAEPRVPDAKGWLDPIDPLQHALFTRFGIEVPVFSFPPVEQKLVRVSTPAYVTPDDVDRLAAALATLGAVGERG